MNKRTIKIKQVDQFEGMLGKKYYDFLFSKLNERYSIVFSEEPDYLLCGCFSDDFLKYDCIKIFVTGENITPDFNLYDYAVGFDYLDYGDRYLRYPIYPYWTDDFEDAVHKHERSDQYFENKSKFCNFVYSNNVWNDKIREKIFFALSEYKKVDSGGRVLNNIGEIVGDKRQFQEEYKFALAIENSCKSGYITEKIINAYAAGNIPIYWGAPEITKEFNPKSFINVSDFESLDSCIDFVKKIDENPGLYLEMQHEPIFTDMSLGKKYYDEKDLLYNFFCSIFDKPYQDAKRVFNRSTGYNKEYHKIIKRGWGLTMSYKKPYRWVRDLIKNNT